MIVLEIACVQLYHECPRTMFSSIKSKSYSNQSVHLLADPLGFEDTFFIVSNELK